MIFPPQVEWFLRIMVFLTGASIGSFLNVVIYRVPLGISVRDPKRSFCPSCKNQIPWYLNIPIFSWIALRGKCARCGTGISPRYLVVEVLTGFLFLVVWLWWMPTRPQVVLPYWILMALFVVTIYIDFEHFIIPDEVTKGGMVAGVVLSGVFPALMQVGPWWQGVCWSLAGAAVGLGLLWLIVEAGKKAFGRIRFEFEEGDGEPFVFCQDEEGGEPALTLEGERYFWSEIFFRKTDRLVVTATSARFDDEAFGACGITVTEKGFSVVPEPSAEAASGDGTSGGGPEPRTFELESLERVEGVARRVVVPREAMGLGDVKFMGMVGAFLGWKAVLFTVFAASVLGTSVALPARLTGRQGWAAKIPFGPYLVVGAVVWMFFGQQILGWYWGLAGG